MDAKIQPAPGYLPDSVSDLLALQKNLIVELKTGNRVCHGANEELNFLRKQNNILNSQIDLLYTIMDKLRSDRHLDGTIGPVGIA